MLVFTSASSCKSPVPSALIHFKLESLKLHVITFLEEFSDQQPQNVGVITYSVQTSRLCFSRCSSFCASLPSLPQRPQPLPSSMLFPIHIYIHIY
ncbi:hypothetical protein PS1_009294 [Malus domestica]